MNIQISGYVAERSWWPLVEGGGPKKKYQRGFFVLRAEKVEDGGGSSLVGAERTPHPRSLKMGGSSFFGFENRRWEVFDLRGRKIEDGGFFGDRRCSSKKGVLRRWGVLRRTPHPRRTPHLRRNPVSSIFGYDERKIPPSSIFVAEDRVEDRNGPRGGSETPTRKFIHKRCILHWPSDDKVHPDFSRNQCYQFGDES